MNNLKVSTRMLLLVSAVSVLLLIVDGLGMYGMRTADASLKLVYEGNTVAAAQLGEIRALQLINRLDAVFRLDAAHAA